MTATTGTGRELTIVRRLAAPREMVFRAWTDPDQLHWFADAAPTPAHPTTVDLRVGGAWRVRLVENEHKSYVTGGVYREIVAPERLVFSWGAVDGWPELDLDRLDDNPLVTVTFGDVDGSTELVLHVGFADRITEEQVASWFATGMTDGWNMTLDRLAPALQTAAR
jgi:uncharacterized protein YndB with AHSA1/START domain